MCFVVQMQKFTLKNGNISKQYKTYVAYFE